MKPQTTWLIVAIIVVVVAIVVFLVFGGITTQAPTSGTAPSTTTQSLGAQIYSNVAPQAAVPQSLPQTNPFGQ